MQFRRRLVDSLVFPAIETVQRRPTLEMLREADRTQWWSHDALIALQVGLFAMNVRGARKNET